MDIVQESGVHLKLGAEVTCLFGEGRLKNTAFSTVCSEAPLYLDCVSSDVQRLSFPRKVILVASDEGRIWRGEAEAIGIEKHDGRSRMQLSRVRWEDLERRRFVRLPVRMPVSLRAVYEKSGDTVISVVEGITADLSMGGSKVYIETPVLKGSLVEFLARLDSGDEVRALGIVAHANDDGSIGISFLDYVGGARDKIEEFLALRAA